MSKTILAFVSFILGSCSMLLLGSHTSTFAQPNPLPPSQATPGRRVIKPGDKIVSIVEGFIPAVASLNDVPVYEGFAYTGKELDLDGFDCTHCTFENVSFKYGGGPFHLGDDTFSGAMGVELTGAARNAYLVVPVLLAQIAAGHTINQPNPNAPIVKTINFDHPVMFTWESSSGPR